MQLNAPGPREHARLMPQSVSHAIEEILDLCATMEGVSQATNPPDGLDSRGTLENLIARLRSVCYGLEETYPIAIFPRETT